LLQCDLSNLSNLSNDLARCPIKLVSKLNQHTFL